MFQIVTGTVHNTMHYIRSGCVHSTCALRAHGVCTARTWRVHCAHMACAVASTAPRSWALTACSSRDTKARSRPPFLLPSPRPGRDIISRLRPPRRPSQVATSIPCRDLHSAQPSKSGCDLKMGSRPQNGVATPKAIVPLRR